jgi:hypothetical protein
MNVLTACGSVDGEVAGRRKYSDSLESLEGCGQSEVQKGGIRQILC